MLLNTDAGIHGFQVYEIRKSGIKLNVKIDQDLGGF
jgi:hypothetical protein